MAQGQVDGNGAWKSAAWHASTCLRARPILRPSSAHRACVILSGGLDSATVAEVGKERLGLSHAFTVIAADGERWHCAGTALALRCCRASVWHTRPRACMYVYKHVRARARTGATDLPWASASAEASGLRHVVVRASPDQLLREELHTVVQVLQSFDPMSLRNEIAGNMRCFALCPLVVRCTPTRASCKPPLEPPSVTGHAAAQCALL